MKKAFFITLFFFFFATAFAITGKSDTDTVSVSNKQELKAALSKNILNIKLNNDIHYDDNERFFINSDVNIIGNNHAILNDGSNQRDWPGFTLNKNDLNVSYNNVTFGDNNHIQSWYGILQGSWYRANLKINNVNYIGFTAAQPFYLNKDTKLTFTGNNNFYTTPGKGSGQEFLEGATNIVFDENSVTNIYHNTNTSTAGFLWPSDTTNISVKKNAQVNINTSKKIFCWGANFNLNLDDNSVFKINSTLNGVTMGTNTGNVTLNSGSYFEAVGNGSFGEQASDNINFSTINPRGLLIENKKSKGLFNHDVTLNNKSTFPYFFDYYNPSKQTQPASSGNNILNNNVFGSNSTKLFYHAKTKTIGDVTSTVKSNPLISQINLNNLNIEGPYYYKGIEYKIYQKSLVSDIDSDNSQNIITNDSTADFKGITNDDYVDVTNVPAGNYVVYMRAKGQSLSSSYEDTTSQWIAKDINVKKSMLDITVPIKTDFTVLDNSLFTSDNQYKIVNNSNFTFKYYIDSDLPKKESGSANLVDKIDSDTPNKSIYLALKVRDTKNDILPFVHSADKTMKISVPGFKGESIFNVIGQYKGPINYSKYENLSYIIKLFFE
ncbi:hypothetical protein [Fructobacillus parabroussonetiae]|uniref:Uncharacterized protein n=1 Tax=Fructobacillus parabroussonetiae TaxID=2713174 RepID=A0ABS5R060_9LACO|nr:hypothetical protein [Fructobacillus parabroussonetiae]MBS9338011.1 hypothetical protein [Fructobacillus parabroussonetiae]